MNATTPKRLSSPVAVVTGASSGIGTETALGLACAGRRVILCGRDAQRTDEAASRIERAHPGAVLGRLRADFSSLTEVARLADEVATLTPHLDVLVNNAGLWHPRRTLSKDAYEDTFAVNHLAAFCFTTRLMPLLKATPGARVITVTSRLHLTVPSFDFDDVMSEAAYDGLRAYSQSKLANILFASELARRLKSADVTSNSVHPGSVATHVVRDSRLLSLGSRLVRPLLKSPEQGAATSLYVATAPELAHVTGCYFANRQAHVPSRAARARHAALRLWSLSEELVGRVVR